MNINEILEERGKTHGSFVEFSECCQNLKTIVLIQDARLTAAQREALEMILHKIARIICGDPNHKDHWDDIAGYATLVSTTLDKQHINE